MKSKALIVAGLIAAFSFGCGKSPEKICKKMADFAEKSEKGDKKKSSKDDMDDCVKEMTKLKDKNPDAYKKVGECADLKDSDTAATCIMGVMLADAFKDDAKDKKSEDKKAKADDDDDSKSKKKAKAADDDDDSKTKKKKSADDDDK